MVKERLSGPTTPNSLSVRRGRLRASPAYKIIESRDTVTLLVFMRKGNPGVFVHEFGATIRPVRAQFLAIPLGPARTAAGVSRGGPRAFQPLVTIKSRSGNLLLVKKRGEDFTPMFVLKRSVRVPARLGFRKTWQEELYKIKAEINAAIDSVRRVKPDPYSYYRPRDAEPSKAKPKSTRFAGKTPEQIQHMTTGVDPFLGFIRRHGGGALRGIR